MAQLKQSIIQFVDSLITRYPRFGRAVRTTYWGYHKSKLRYETRFRSVHSGDQNIDPYKIVSVNPDKIRYYGQAVFHPWDAAGEIKDGDWDTDQYRFEDLPMFRGLHDHFVDSVEWEETDWYADVLAVITGEESRNTDGVSNKDIGPLEAVNTENPYGCSSVEEFYEYLNYIDYLYESISENGYKSQSELISEQRDTDITDKTQIKQPKEGNEITVNIDRDGELLFNDGRHRLSIAKILGIESIPVRILVRHKEWVQFRLEFITHTFGERSAVHGNEKVYTSPPHPDLRHLPASHDSEVRFEMIWDHLKRDSGRVLDIGANLGHFCHIFENKGFECDAVEMRKEEVYFMKKFRDANYLNFNVIDKSIFDFDVGNEEYDITLAMNVFHHLLKTESRYEELIEVLEQLNTDIVFVQFPENGTEGFNDAYMQIDESEFVDLIQQHVGVTKAELLGRPENDNRPIYKLYYGGS